MNWEALGGLIRHALTTLGGVAVAKGYIDESTMAGGVGAIMTLLGIAWSLWAKRGKSAPTVQAHPLAVLGALMLGMLVLGGCSAPQIASGVKASLTVDAELREFTIQDVRVAQAMATAQNDAIALQCYDYLLVALPELGQGVDGPTDAVGVISAFQKARGAVRGFQEVTVTDQFIMACSPLYVSARDDVIGIAQMFGRLSL